MNNEENQIHQSLMSIAQQKTTEPTPQSLMSIAQQKTTEPVIKNLRDIISSKEKTVDNSLFGIIKQKLGLSPVSIENTPEYNSVEYRGLFNNSITYDRKVKPEIGNPEGINRPQRNNNPLNLKSSEFTRSFGGVAGEDPNPASDGGKFLIFESPEAGLEAAKKLITSSGYNKLSVNNALKRWSNNGYGGEIIPYLSGKMMANLSSSELMEVVNKMASREGFFSKK